MGVYRKAIITNAGRMMLARAVAGEQIIQFSHVCTSDYIYPDGTDFEGMAVLEGVKQRVLPTDVWVTGDSFISVRAMFGNENILIPYLTQNIGLYAMDGDTEVLFSISGAETPDQVPAYNGVAPSSFVYNIQLAVSQVADIAVSVNPAGTITVQEIQDVRKELGTLRRTVTVLVPALWTETAPYTQEIAVAGLKVGDPAEIWSAVSEETTAADAKMWDKMASMISYSKILEDGKLTLGCLNKKPTVAFQIRLKGVSV